MNTITVSNSVDPDQARHVGSDLGPNLLCQGYQQTTLYLVGKELINGLKPIRNMFELKDQERKDAKNLNVFKCDYALV